MSVCVRARVHVYQPVGDQPPPRKRRPKTVIRALAPWSTRTKIMIMLINKYNNNALCQEILICVSEHS